MTSYNPKYQPHLPEEEEAYFHGQVDTILKMKFTINELRGMGGNKDSEDYTGFHLALFNMERILKNTLDNLEVEFKKENM